MAQVVGFDEVHGNVGVGGWGVHARAKVHRRAQAMHVEAATMKIPMRHQAGSSRRGQSSIVRNSNYCNHNVVLAFLK